jgi:uncharacterized protein (DUF952 family)
MAQMKIYKVLSSGDWSQAQVSGSFVGSPDDARDGFIHFSTAEQLQGTLDRHFAGQKNLVVLEVDAAALGEALRWEASRGGALFPHLYGELPVVAVLRAVSPDAV